MPDVYATITEADPAIVEQLADIPELRAANPEQRELRDAYRVREPRRPQARMIVARTAAILAVLLLPAACTGGDEESSATLPQGSETVALEPGDFSTTIDNRYWPMEPGTRWTYREIDEEGRELRVVVTVTSATKRIANGITARVVRDTVSQDGELLEDTLDWYAQDADGNVWYLGEDTAEFEDGEVATTEGSWEAGVEGAQPGIALPASPTAGLAYRQEYAAGEAEDDGAVLSVDELVEVPAGRYRHALLTKDTNALEPDVLEYKLYAPGVGPVLTLGVSGGGGREELVERGRVDAATARKAGTAPLGVAYD